MGAYMSRGGARISQFGAAPAGQPVDKPGTRGRGTAGLRRAPERAGGGPARGRAPAPVRGGGGWPETAVTPVTLIGLANLGRPRRPAGATTAAAEPVLPDPATATRQLAPLAAGLVTEADLPSLRQVQQLAVQAATALLSGQAPACAGLNTLASSSTARTELAVTGGRLHARLVWQDAPAAAALARRLIEELAAADPGRLRRCARPACSLLFYDNTRSRTRRWHAENPCGWRERQQHRRARP